MIYLNNAATSFPKPKRVKNAVAQHLNSPPFHAGRTGYDLQQKDIILSCRKVLASLLHIKNPERIVFTSGATESLCLAIFGLELRDKAHVITTAIEHNSVLRPLKTLEKEGAITLTVIPCNSAGKVEASSVIKQIGDETRVVVVNHCSNVSGAVTDLAEIGKVTSAKDVVFLVDAAQSAGNIPLNVEEMHIDLLAFTGHKALHGIQGIGGLFIRESVNIKPLKVGGTGVKSDYLLQPEAMPLYYEAGTQNMPGIVSLYEGVSLVLEKGIKVLQEVKAERVQRMIDHLSKHDDIILYYPEDQDGGTCLFSFNIKNMDPADLGYILENVFDIIIRSGLHCAPLVHQALNSYPLGSIRVSPSHFTTDEEITFFLNAIDKICEGTSTTDFITDNME
ncbi:MAG: aminotransferase class V-fold PLP-dependent enzyme [Desulfobulbaceae bacterium]|nr:aminotransferase class V-fold PLP-dependent enzyme [Desulfobulbaceae bacterium]